MLVEKNAGQQRVAIGETVKITTTGATGTIIGYSAGKWEVRTTDGNTVLVNESQLQVRQVLFG